LKILPLKDEKTDKIKNLTCEPFIRQPIKLLNNVDPGQIILTAPFENYEANKSSLCNWLIIMHKKVSHVYITCNW